MRTGSDDMQQTTGNLTMMRRMARLMKPLAGTEGKAILCGSLGHLFAVWSMPSRFAFFLSAPPAYQALTFLADSLSIWYLL